MTQPNLRELLHRLLADDEPLYEQLCASGLLPAEDAALQPQHLETARVVRTLVQELEINWPGVEVIVRMRAQLVATQRQVAELAELVRQLQERKP